MTRTPNASYIEDPILLLAACAREAACTSETLINEAKRGKLTIMKLSARRYGIRASEWRRYMDAIEVVK
jgi:hypothetical protein